MRLPVVDHMLIDLVRDYDQVVFDSERFQRREVSILENPATGIIGRIDQNRSRARRDGGGDCVPAHAEICTDGDRHRDRTSDQNIRNVAIVCGFEDDHFVARSHAAEDGIEDGLGRPGSDCDLRIPVVVRPIEACDLARNGLAQ